MSNILVTGSSGFLGRHVVKYFKKKNHTVYGVSRKNIEGSYSVNVADFHTINEIVSEKSIDIIVHLAGKPIVYDCEKNPFDAFMVNGMGTASVLEAARLNDVKRVVSIETDKVYGIQNVLPTNETATLNPGSPYEFSKALASNISDFYRKYYDMSIISVRPANIYGPGDASTSRIIPSALNNLREGRGIRLYSNALEMERDFVYIKDVTRAIYLLATNDPKHDTYNISTNDPMKIGELADKILSILTLSIPHNIIEKKEFNEILQQQIDGGRFIQEFDFKFTSFEDGILKIWRKMQ